MGAPLLMLSGTLLCNQSGQNHFALKSPSKSGSQTHHLLRKEWKPVQRDAREEIILKASDWSLHLTIWRSRGEAHYFNLLKWREQEVHLKWYTDFLHPTEVLLFRLYPLQYVSGAFFCLSPDNGINWPTN